ncbi:MAG: hypothetical protein GQ569_02000 [Methylococcaceae bacterium]|nr:hypothetical protein [Methylococcaceae bacterium]
MNKQTIINYAKSVAILACLLLNGCGGNSASKAAVFVDVETYTSNGIAAYANSKWNQAQNYFSKALELYQGIDHQEGILLSYINLAEVSLSQHNYHESKQYLTLAAAIANDDLLQNYRPRINLLYALIALQQKQLMEAETILQKILPTFEGVMAVSIPNTIQLAAIASQTKIAFLKKQDESLWTHRYENSLEKAANKNTDRKARLLRFQASLLLQQGEEKKAEAKMQQALALYKQNVSRQGIAVTLLELARHYQTKQHWQEARDYLKRSKAVYNFLGDNEKVKLITEILTQVTNITQNELSTKN